MQFQTELRLPLFQVGQKPLGLMTVLKSQYEVIGASRDDDFAMGIPFPPLLYRVKNQPVVGEPKSKRGRRSIRLRTVPISNPAGCIGRRFGTP